jgi:hypothetical protein
VTPFFRFSLIIQLPNRVSTDNSHPIFFFACLKSSQLEAIICITLSKKLSVLTSCVTPHFGQSLRCSISQQQVKQNMKIRLSQKPKNRRLEYQDLGRNKIGLHWTNLMLENFYQISHLKMPRVQTIAFSSEACWTVIVGWTSLYDRC